MEALFFSYLCRAGAQLPPDSVPGLVDYLAWSGDTKLARLALSHSSPEVAAALFNRIAGSSQAGFSVTTAVLSAHSDPSVVWSWVRSLGPTGKRTALGRLQAFPTLLRAVWALADDTDRRMFVRDDRLESEVVPAELAAWLEREFAGYRAFGRWRSSSYVTILDMLAQSPRVLEMLRFTGLMTVLRLCLVRVKPNGLPESIWERFGEDDLVLSEDDLEELEAAFSLGLAPALPREMMELLFYRFGGKLPSLADALGSMRESRSLPAPGELAASVGGSAVPGSGLDAFRTVDTLKALLVRDRLMELEPAARNKIVEGLADCCFVYDQAVMVGVVAKLSDDAARIFASVVSRCPTDSLLRAHVFGPGGLRFLAEVACELPVASRAFALAMDRPALANAVWDRVLAGVEPGTGTETLMALMGSWNGSLAELVASVNCARS